MSIDLQPSSQSTTIAQDYLSRFEPTPIYQEPDYVGSECILLRKDETKNSTGAFKWRGALYAAIMHIQRNPYCEEFVAASAGNHSQGVAKAAQELGRTAISFMPKYTPKSKIEGNLKHKARINNEAEAFESALELAEEYEKNNPNSHLIHPYNDPDVIMGNSFIGDELVDQLKGKKNITILVPTGGGGLVAAVSKAIKTKRSDIEVIGVVVEDSDSSLLTFEDSFMNLEVQEAEGIKYVRKTPGSTYTGLNIHSVTNPNPLIDGVKVKQPGEFAAKQFIEYTDGFIKVPTLAVARLASNDVAQNHELNQQLPDVDWCEFSAEPAGLLAKAGALAIAQVHPRSRRTYVYLKTGANYDESTMHRLADLYDDSKLHITTNRTSVGCISAPFSSKQF